MRVTRVPAKPSGAAGIRPAARHRESLLLALVACLLAYGFWQVYRSRGRFLDTAAQRLASGQTLLLSKLTPASQVARYLTAYDNPRQRQLIAGKIADLLRRERPANVGALARLHVTRDEATRRGVLDLYATRFEHARADTVRLFTGDEFAERVKPAFAVRAPDEFRSSFLKWAMLFFLGFAAVHGLWILLGFRGDPWLLPLVCLLCGTGFILMTSLRDPVRDMPLFADFGSGVLAGCVVLAFVTSGSHLLELRRQGLLRRPAAAGRLLDQAGEALRLIEKRGDLAFALSIGLSVALLLFGTGPGESGVKVRLLFFQPVEVIRFLLVLFLASYFARRWEFLRELKERRVQLGIDVPRLDYALPVMIAVALSIGFFFLQRDMGPALVLAALFLALYAVARARAGLVLAALGVLISVGWLSYRIGYPPVVVTRVGMWLRPWDNGLAHGDQLVHSLWAMATGAIRGAGIGRGMPEIIPAGHTDLVLPVLAEETGFLGLVLVVAAYAVLFWRSLRIANRAATAYEFFLALGLTIGLALQGALIAGGVAGILPLTGVVTPFLTYGSSAMVLDCLAIGVLLAISAKSRRAAPLAEFRRPVMVMAASLAAFAAVVLVKAGSVAVVRADDIVASGTLVQQEDGSYAMSYNPRLLAVARQIPRGAIYDRTGLPLATSRWDELEKHRAAYAAAGIDIDKACPREERRHYPFGAVMFHLLGDLRTRRRWTASNAAFEERLSRGLLQGFDDREALDTVTIPRTGRKARVYRYDYSELVPLLRAGMDPGNAAVRKILDTPHNVRLSVDARLQARLTRAFQEHLRSHGWKEGAVVVIQPATGELLAAVSLPLPHLTADAAEADDSTEPIDFARFGQYPPGSSFKLVTAIAALRRDPSLASKTYQCVRLPDGRIGNTVRGRAIRDDVEDTQPHGTLDMRQALVRSCNAYFAQLGAHDVGAQALQSAASLFNIDTARPNTARRLMEYLPQASYGQGEVLVTPYRMARVAGAIANHGALAPVKMRLAPAEPGDEAAVPVLPPELDRELETAMRAVVTSGTGRAAAGAAGGIAGKTGTAEVTGEPAHAWFAGFTPYEAPAGRRVAFAILIENARYGGRAAAPFALRIAEAARGLQATGEDYGEKLEETDERAGPRPARAARSTQRRPRGH